MLRSRCLALIFGLLASSFVLANEKPDALVFILAGQSNMEGKGSVETLTRQMKDEEKSKLFEGLTKNGAFYARDDVSISYLGGRGIRHGALEIGYATSQKNDKRMFGPELGFGWQVGDHCPQHVLIIKTAWGGKSIDRNFRPPSRGYPKSIDQHFENRKKKKPDYTREQCEKEYGHYYRLMIDHVKTVLNDSSTKEKYANIQLAGFVWFQGFNDQFAPTSVADYEDNMVAFIKDVRQDLAAPNLPFVIGAMGHGGKQQKGKVQQIADAQAAAATHFNNGSVVTVRTAQFWDEDAQAAFETYWQDKQNRDLEMWRNFGNDRPYHYHGSPRFFWQTGNAFGIEMLKLIGANDE